MKKIAVVLFGFGTILLSSCDVFGCDCEYVSYDNYNGEGWMETYRSTWDDCEDGLLDESVYTSHDGTKIYSKTIIETASNKT